jgi:hypothetical protein
MGSNKEWHGLMEILSVEHIRDGKVLYREENIKNTLHFLGEAFLLQALFMGGYSPSIYIPDQYYLGLDARGTIAVADTMASVFNEPFVNGYTRQPVSSTNGFSLDVVSGVHRATSQIVSFSAAGGSWGPVSNIFLSDKPNNTGVLISSAQLTSPVTVLSGDSVNMRMALSLRFCPIV